MARGDGWAARWRDDLDALEFRPADHAGLCMVHRLALRKFLGRAPDMAACMAFFAEQTAGFDAAASEKIARQALAATANLHLTSRDLARLLTAPHVAATSGNGGSS